MKYIKYNFVAVRLVPHLRRNSHIAMSSTLAKACEKRQLDVGEHSIGQSSSKLDDEIDINVKKAKIEIAPSDEQPKIFRRSIIIQSIPLENPEIFVENGLRKVKPYWFKYMTSVKGRWKYKRLIDVLKQEFHGKNPDFFETAIRLNRLTVNNETKPLDYVLKESDVLTNVAHRHEVPVLDRPFKIVLEDDNVLVIDKPCSLPVHPCGRYYFNSLTSILETDHKYKDLKLMYRLDRLTSGLMIISKNCETDVKLKRELVDRKVRKEYVCLVEGEFPSKPMICSKSIEPCEPKMGVQWIRPDGQKGRGKECTTEFHLLKTNGKVSAVRCLPKTGRTHQIRVHLQYLGFPIINDYMYNNLVWGEEKGENGHYGRSHEQLRTDLMKAFGAENWVVDFEESAVDFMQHKEKLDDKSGYIDLASIEFKPGKSTVYDPFCIDCHVQARIPTEKQLEMYLHCWKYKGTDWEYETDLPEWAKELPVDVINP